MRLERFWVGNYRSIRDSGWIETGTRTVFVGRNESGKSNLLYALRTLNPFGELDRLSATQDYPADLPRSTFSPDLDVVRSVWALSEPERAELARLMPEGARVTHVEVGRRYASGSWVRFQGLPTSGARSEPRASTETRVESGIERVQMLSDEAPESESFFGAFDPQGDVEVPEPSADASDGEKSARDWILSRLPRFQFLDEYPDIEGHQNLCEFLRRKKDGTRLPGDEYFEMLLVAADLDPEAIDILLTADPDTRRLLLADAGRVVTRRLRELWTDRPLRVRFDLDGEHFHTLISDPNSLYEVEVNLNGRSRGFRWFFSFYVMFAAAAKARGQQPPILLLDEPGLHLHPLGQQDLLNHLAEFENQVILSTQSPFMVPTDAIDQVRTVNVTEEAGTTVSNAPEADEKTVFPIRHVLGAQIATSLFGDEWALVVEDITDFWYLRAVSNFIAGRGGTALPGELRIYPAGGATSVLAMVGLLAPSCTNTVVLRSELSTEPVSARLEVPERAVLVVEALGDGATGALDVEDLLGARAFDQLTRIAHKTQLQGVDIQPDTSIPRLVPRYDRAFAQEGLSFSRTRVARVFLHAMAQNPDGVLPDESRERFERLFAAICTRLRA